MSLNRLYTTWWYLIMAAAGVVELLALLDKRPGDTFTEHVRQWLSLQSRTAWPGEPSPFVSWRGFPGIFCTP